MIRFLRPLPSLLVWLDYRLFHDSGLGPHIVSFLCWAAAVVGAYELYFILFGEIAALLGAAIFALAPAHEIPLLLWAANREVLLATALAAFALKRYVRWRDAPSRAAALSCAVMSGMAFLSGEYAVCIGGYVLAFELSRRDSFDRALKGLLPVAIPLGLYGALRGLLGYGTRHSGIYRDPRTTWPGTC